MPERRINTMSLKQLKTQILCRNDNLMIHDTNPDNHYSILQGWVSVYNLYVYTTYDALIIFCCVNTFLYIQCLPKKEITISWFRVLESRVQSSKIYQGHILLNRLKMYYLIFMLFLWLDFLKNLHKLLNAIYKLISCYKTSFYVLFLNHVL